MQIDRQPAPTEGRRQTVADGDGSADLKQAAAGHHQYRQREHVRRPAPGLRRNRASTRATSPWSASAAPGRCTPTPWAELMKLLAGDHPARARRAVRLRRRHHAGAPTRHRMHLRPPLRRRPTTRRSAASWKSWPRPAPLPGAGCRRRARATEQSTLLVRTRPALCTARGMQSDHRRFSPEEFDRQNGLGWHRQAASTPCTTQQFTFALDAEHELVQRCAPWCRAAETFAQAEPCSAERQRRSRRPRWLRARPRCYVGGSRSGRRRSTTARSLKSGDRHRVARRIVTEMDSTTRAAARSRRRRRRRTATS